MKNVLILHGTNSDNTQNWFPWLRSELERRGFNVWVPNLPRADHPNIDRYNEFIFNNHDWQFTDESILIGHSSGAVAVLGLLQALPEGIIVDMCILVCAFKDDLGWESLKELFLKPFDFQAIKKKAKHFVFLHSDNDPHCPLDHAKYLSEQVGGELIVLPGQGHFNTDSDPKYKEFPFLLNLIPKRMK